jgi:hypothetical protein
MYVRAILVPLSVLFRTSYVESACNYAKFQAEKSDSEVVLKDVPSYVLAELNMYGQILNIYIMHPSRRVVTSTW